MRGASGGGSGYGNSETEWDNWPSHCQGTVVEKNGGPVVRELAGDRVQVPSLTQASCAALGV